LKVRILPTERTAFDDLIASKVLREKFNILPHVECLSTMRDGTQVFKVLLTAYYPSKATHTYRARSYEGRIKPNSICYHGHYVFMDWLFKAVPTAKFQTWQAQAVGYRWVTKENFTAMARDLAELNLGSQIRPAYAADLCFCSEQATPGLDQTSYSEFF
jgi:hypothetical protein